MDEFVDAQAYIDKVLLRAHISRRTYDRIMKLRNGLSISNVAETIESVKRLVETDDDQLTYEEVEQLEEKRVRAWDAIIFWAGVLGVTLISISDLGRCAILGCAMSLLMVNISEYSDAVTGLINK